MECSPDGGAIGRPAAQLDGGRSDTSTSHTHTHTHTHTKKNARLFIEFFSLGCGARLFLDAVVGAVESGRRLVIFLFSSSVFFGVACVCVCVLLFLWPPDRRDRVARYTHTHIDTRTDKEREKEREREERVPRVELDASEINHSGYTNGIHTEKLR